MLAIPIESKGHNQGCIVRMPLSLHRNCKITDYYEKECSLLYLELPNGAYGCLNSRLDISASRIHEQLLSLSPSCCGGPSS